MSKTSRIVLFSLIVALTFSFFSDKSDLKKHDQAEIENIYKFLNAVNQLLSEINESILKTNEVGNKISAKYRNLDPTTPEHREKINEYRNFMLLLEKAVKTLRKSLENLPAAIRMRPVNTENLAPIKVELKEVKTIFDDIENRLLK